MRTIDSYCLNTEHIKRTCKHVGERATLKIKKDDVNKYIYIDQWDTQDTCYKIDNHNAKRKRLCK